MAFTRRWAPQIKPAQCPQCGKESSIQTRPDKLGTNCAKFIDEAKAKLEKKRAGEQ
jgi:hypothetical protein